MQKKNDMIKEINKFEIEKVVCVHKIEHNNKV